MKAQGLCKVILFYLWKSTDASEHHAAVCISGNICKWCSVLQQTGKYISAQ